MLPATILRSHMARILLARSAGRTLAMLGTRPSAVTRARSMNTPKGRPRGLPWNSAIVALLSKAAGQWELGRPHCELGRLHDEVGA